MPDVGPTSPATAQKADLCIEGLVSADGSTRLPAHVEP